MKRDWDFGAPLRDNGTNEFRLYVHELFTDSFTDERRLSDKIDDLLLKNVSHKDIQVVQINTKKWSVLDMRNRK